MVFAASSTAQAGPLGLAVIVVIGLALFFLIRSMNTHLRRVPRSFSADEAAKKDAPEPKSSGPSGSDPAD